MAIFVHRTRHRRKKQLLKNDELACTRYHSIILTHRNRKSLRCIDNFSLTTEPAEGKDMIGEGGIEHCERNSIRGIGQCAEHVIFSKIFSVASSFL
jgi:hypothetical protein